MCHKCEPEHINSELNYMQEVLASPNVFLNNNSLKNNLTGSLSGSVKFAQTHTIDPSGNSDNEMPRLVSTRDTLVMFIPSKNVTSVKIQVRNGSGKRLKTSDMKSPEELPKADRPSNSKNPDCIYYDNAWSFILLADWVQPGLKLSFVSNTGDSGSLENIDIGPETQVILQNIRIGMLTDYNSVDENLMENYTHVMANDYFQKIPASELIVGNYEPVKLNEVVLSSGVKYTDKSSVNGDVYSGDLRENIAKALYSMGIDNANFGINSSKGGDEWQGELAHIVTVHQSWGNYQNGRVQHGLSGGYGMATLYDTHGNEFSHEIGHSYGMGHWPGAGKWCVHNTYSGWGWDRNKNKFIANFFWDRNNSVTETNGGYTHTVEPFLGIYQFNKDTMGGGEASSPISKYTHHTGYTQKRIQQWLENKAVITPVSDTGYLVWDKNSKKMVSKSGGDFRKPDQFGVPVVTLIGYYDPEKKLNSYIYPALHGSYGYTYKPEPLKAGQFSVKVTYKDKTFDIFGIENKTLKNGHMNKFHVNVPESKEPEYIEVFDSNNVIITSRDIEKYKIKPMPCVKVGRIYGQQDIENPIHNVTVVNGEALEKEHITELFQTHNRLNVSITNERWTPEIHFPDILNNKQSIKISSTANKNTTVFYNNKEFLVKKGYEISFTLIAHWEEDTSNVGSDEFYTMKIKNGIIVEEKDISNVLKKHDKVKVEMRDSYWSPKISIPAVNKDGQIFKIKSDAQLSTTISTNDMCFYFNKDTLNLKSSMYWDVYIDALNEDEDEDEDEFFELPFNDSEIITDSYLLDYQKKHNKLVINNTNACWTPEVHIPDFLKDAQVIKVTSVADKITDIFHGGNKFTLKKHKLALLSSTAHLDVKEYQFDVKEYQFDVKEYQFDESDDFYYIPVTNDITIEKYTISDALKKHKNVGINLNNGLWTGKIHIPEAEKSNQKIKITSSAKYKTSIFYGDYELSIGSGSVLEFKSFMDWIIERQ